MPPFNKNRFPKAFGWPMISVSAMIAIPSSRDMRERDNSSSVPFSSCASSAKNSSTGSVSASDSVLDVVIPGSIASDGAVSSCDSSGVVGAVSAGSVLGSVSASAANTLGITLNTSTRTSKSEMPRFCIDAMVSILS